MNRLNYQEDTVTKGSSAWPALCTSLLLFLASVGCCTIELLKVGEADRKSEVKLDGRCT